MLCVCTYECDEYAQRISNETEWYAIRLGMKLYEVVALNRTHVVSEKESAAGSSS